MKALLAILIILSSVVALGLGIQHIQQEHEKYKQSSACIMKYVSQGIDRKDVERVNYTCKIKKKGE